MTNNKTIRERLAILETKLDNQLLMMKGVLIAIFASIGINIAV